MLFWLRHVTWRHTGKSPEFSFLQPLMRNSLRRLSLTIIFGATWAGTRGRTCKQHVTCVHAHTHALKHTHSWASSVSSRGLCGLQDDQDTPPLPLESYSGPEHTAEGTGFWRKTSCVPSITVKRCRFPIKTCTRKNLRPLCEPGEQRDVSWKGQAGVLQLYICTLGEAETQGIWGHLRDKRVLYLWKYSPV